MESDPELKHPEIMKTEHITAAYRNATTPAACLAAWQATPARRRLSEIRARMEKPYFSAVSFAETRREMIAAQGPELSAPDAEKPLLWLSGESDPEALETFAGRDFLNHCGWFMDEDQIMGTLETYAIRLARFPRLMFYGVKDSENGNIRVELSDWEEIDFSESDCSYHATEAIEETARQVIRSNDSSTEREADDCRDFYRKDRLEQDIAENRETLAELRGEIRTLCHELKTLCPLPIATDYPAAAQAVRRALADLLNQRRRLMDENETLAASL